MVIAIVLAIAAVGLLISSRKIRDYNDGLIKTHCRSRINQPEPTSCPDDSFDRNYRTVSKTCYYPHFIVEYNNRTESIPLGTLPYNYESAHDIVERWYPVGMVFDCWYERDDPSKLVLSVVSPNLLLAAFVITLIISVSIWTGSVWYHYARNKEIENGELIHVAI